MDRDRAVGTLWGLACGDALGRPVEFETATAIERTHGRVTEMLANGTWNKPAGTVTDDTDLALCVARSLVGCGRFDGDDVARRFADWLDSGPFDVGGMTREAIREYQQGTAWDDAGRLVWERKPEGANAGNGSVMRCAPHAVAFDDRDRLCRVSRASSAIAHADPRCTWGCAVLNLTLAGLPAAADPTTALADAVDAVAGEAPDELLDALRPVATGDEPDALRSTGYVVDTLQTALYEGLTAPSGEDAVVRAVNRGGDADTVGAVTGAVAGARFGREALPERWLVEVDHRDELRELAEAMATTFR